MTDILLPIVAFLVVLGPVVLIHELGHFVAARMIGVTVLEFGLGFPPRAARLFESQGTEFTLNWLPIGGFVRPLGEDFVKPVGEGEIEPERAMWNKIMDERAAKGLKTFPAKSLMQAGPWQRIWFMVAGAVFNFISALILLTIGGMIGMPGPAVEISGVIAGSPAEVAGLKVGDQIAAIDGKTTSLIEDNARLLGMKPDDEGYINDILNPKPIAVTVRREGKSFDVTIPPADKRQEGNGIWVTAVDAGSPAATVLKPLDVIISADATKAVNTDSFKAYIDSKKGTEITLTIRRAGQEQQVKIVPRKDPPSGQGALGIAIVPLFYSPQYGYAVFNNDRGPIVSLSLGEAAVSSVQSLGRLFSNLVETPVKLITGQLRGAEARVVSPVGIAQISGQVIQRASDRNSISDVISFIAFISVAIGFTNLLPIPGLDGGRILFVLIELIRGKPMKPEREGMVHLVGLMVLLGLVAVLVINDIINPIGTVIR